MTIRLNRYSFAILFATTTLRAVAAMAQAPNAVQPERPTVATHAGTVARGWLELEIGGQLDRYSAGIRGGVFPFVAKIGLAPRLLLSLIGTIGKAPGVSSVGAGDLAVGLQWRIADSLPLSGRFAVQPTLELPTGSTASGVASLTTDAGLLLISSHLLGPLALDLNAGFTHRAGHDDSVPENATVWTVSFGGPAAGAVGWVAEVFGYPRTSGPAGNASTVSLLAGPTFSVREWRALDAGLIIPLGGSPPHSLYVGGVWNVGRMWR